MMLVGGRKTVDDIRYREGCYLLLEETLGKYPQSQATKKETH